MKKTLLSILSFILFTVNICSDSKDFFEVSLQLKWHHQFQFAGYYMAKEKGFYSNEQINVKILEGGPNVNVEEIISKGEADFGILGSELLIHKANGKRFVVIAPIMQHSIRAIFARSDLGINSIHDLKDKTIMLNKSESAEFEAMFKYEGLDFSQFNVLIKNEEANDLFISGEIDAMNGSIANQPYLFMEKGIKIIQIRPISYGIDFYGDTLFSREETIWQNKKMVSSFKDASLKGWSYAFQNPEETINVIIHTYNSKKSRSQLNYEYEKLRDLIRPDLVEIGHNNIQRWERIEQIFINLKLIPQKDNLRGFFFNPFRDKGIFIKRTLILMSIIVFGFALFFINVMFINRKLHSLVNDKIKEIQSIIDSMPSMIIEINKNYNITLWNKNAEFQSGKKSKNVLSKNLFKILPFITFEKPKIKKCLRENIVLSNNRFSIKINDETQFKRLTIYPLQLIDQKRVVIHIEDITEQVKMSELVVQSEKMSSIGSLAAGIAHEINNPLAGILQTSNVIENRLITKINSIDGQEAAINSGVEIEGIVKFLSYRNVPHMLENINESSTRITDIVNNMLGYVNKDFGLMEKIDFPTLMDKTLSLASLEYNQKTKFDFKQIEIVKYYDENLPEYKNSRTKIQQVFLNLIRNAAHAMKINNTEFPKITIKVTTSLTNKAIQVQINDNGPGIKKGSEGKIFEPFFTTKEVGKGTGLGLSLCYYIVTQDLGGKLSVSSLSEGGASFTIELPYELKKVP